MGQAREAMAYGAGQGSYGLWGRPGKLWTWGPCIWGLGTWGSGDLGSGIWDLGPGDLGTWVLWPGGHGVLTGEGRKPNQ